MPPKKAAKKTPAKSAAKHDEEKDLRRAHEHQGRVLALHSALGKHGAEVQLLTDLAAQQLAASHFKDAADLLRAAEHLSFGVLASAKADENVSDVLEKSLREEFQHKLGKANEHWEDTEELSDIYQHCLAEAQKAFDGGAYRKALELVRAAEALTHVHLHQDDVSEEVSDKSDEL